MGSYGSPQLLSGVSSGADYRKVSDSDAGPGLYRFVKLVTTDGVTTVVVAAADQATIGILQNQPNTGQVADVAMAGGIGAKVKLGGTVSRGDYLKSDASGDAVLAGPGEWAGAIAMENGVDNDIISVVPVYMQVPVVIVSAMLADISTASSVFVASPVAGRVVKVVTTLQGAISGADSVVTPKIGATAMTATAITVAYSGSAAGDVDSTVPTALNVVAVGDALNIASGGQSTDTAQLLVQFHIVPKAS